MLKSKWEGDDLRVAVKPIEPRAGIPVVEDLPQPRDVVVESTRRGAAQQRLEPDAKLAEKALRDHFTRMAYGTPAEAYKDFTPAIQAKTPFERYQINVRKQKYVPSVANMPDQAFRVISANSSSATIHVNEKWITGLNILWSYGLVKRNGVWLIDSFRIISPKEW